MVGKSEGTSEFKPKKKYLYLDKFTKHQDEDTVWKLSTSERIKKIKDRVDGLVWWVLAGCAVSVVAMLISVMK